MHAWLVKLQHHERNSKVEKRPTQLRYSLWLWMKLINKQVGQGVLTERLLKDGWCRIGGDLQWQWRTVVFGVLRQSDGSVFRVSSLIVGVAEMLCLACDAASTIRTANERLAAQAGKRRRTHRN